MADRAKRRVVSARARSSHPRRDEGPDAAPMKRAVAMARKGLGATYPNPSVGVVIVREGEVIATGRTRPTGQAHAEVVALARAGAAARGATLYTTLEPCCHQGLTPPCTDAIVAAGIRRVVVGVRDPAAQMSGRGLRKLRRAGVEVVEGVLTAACTSVHEHYLHHLVTGRPFVTLKSAVSLDGRLAVRTGQSRWITGPEARVFAHQLRAEHHAIAVGAETVVVDDPQLDVRHVRGVSPLVVVFDGELRCLSGSRRPRVLREGTWFVHRAGVSQRRLAKITALGAKSLVVETDGAGRPSVEAALEALGRMAVRSLLVEGGGRLVGSFVAGNAWNRWFVMQAPKILGDGPAMAAGLSYRVVDDGPRVEVEFRRVYGDDLLTCVRPR